MTPLMGNTSTGETALVTGAGARVGRAVALELARAGARVWVHYHQSEEGARETLALIEAQGGEGRLIQADLSSRAEVDALAEQVLSAGERLDVLVHNASRFEPAPFEVISDEAWDEMLEVNLTTPARLTRALLPALRAASGLVITLCDIGAERPLSGYAHYSVSKAGLVMLTRALAVELAPEVRCVGLSPGQVAWPPNMPQLEREALTKRIPMKACGRPEDVARLARFVWREGQYLLSQRNCAYLSRSTCRWRTKFTIKESSHREIKTHPMVTADVFTHGSDAA